jgi:hypothetical protein
MIKRFVYKFTIITEASKRVGVSASTYRRMGSKKGIEGQRIRKERREEERSQWKGEGRRAGKLWRAEERRREEGEEDERGGARAKRRERREEERRRGGEGRKWAGIGRRGEVRRRGRHHVFVHLGQCRIVYSGRARCNYYLVVASLLVCVNGACWR